MAPAKRIEAQTKELLEKELTPRGPSQLSSISRLPLTQFEIPVDLDNELPQKDENRPNILPHSDHAGSPYYIGGMYDKGISRSIWEIDTANRPYLRYLKSLGEGWPHITWLADFMEVGTSPIKWKFLTDEDIELRAKRTRVAVLNFTADGKTPTRQNIQSSKELREYLEDPGLKHDPDYARLLVVEDLSRDVIELLGAQYDIDPLFFRAQIQDYLWYNTKDPWVELNDLDHIASERNFFNIRYMRPRYFISEKSIDDAKGELGTFNVLRRLEQDLSYRIRQIRKLKGPTVGVVRSKTALWIRKNKGDEKGVLAILVVDPTLSHGYSLWGGPRNLQPCPSMHTPLPAAPPRSTLFEDVLHYLTTMSREDILSIKVEPRALGLPIASLVASDWKTVVSYIITGLTKIEWELEHPDYRDATYGLEGLLDRLHPLRRLIPVYRAMVSESLNTILNPLKIAGASQASAHLRKLHTDFQSILDDIDRLQIRTQNIIGLATTIIGMEENQRAMKMNENLVRVTYLAVIFAPMAFVSSFFSMTPDLSTLKQTFWIYFAVTVPLTVICLVVAIYVKGCSDSFPQWLHQAMLQVLVSLSLRGSVEFRANFNDNLQDEIFWRSLDSLLQRALHSLAYKLYLEYEYSLRTRVVRISWTAVSEMQMDFSTGEFEWFDLSYPEIGHSIPSIDLSVEFSILRDELVDLFVPV
ncbi:hypothetical protein G7Y89_g7425 [Cudoniella acicularis]|uniref:Mg2+ transporter protein, CorA-like/Zinc transport protein ZntB n=1 Tax=Cudoniella acicularis TaxID=354080 RepID=A0A8H4RKU1_9HELO|nr:hypothetical protein G7Y89_g7425 [Cudoniella acicularis]